MEITDEMVQAAWDALPNRLPKAEDIRAALEAALAAPASADEPVAWTDELEAARIELCEFWIGIADDPRTLPEVARRAIETEQALTILGESAKTAAPASAEPVAWQPISTYDLVPRRGEYFPPHALCAHSDHGWIRMGRYEPTLKRWYYSGTNERSQWAQVEGDEPTHWMPLPARPLTIDT